MPSLFDDPNKDYLQDLVGEGKKYKTPQDLARSRIEADNFIEQLKTENAELRGTSAQQREQLSTISRLEDLIKNLESRGQPEPRVEAERPTTQYNPADLDALLESKLSAREKQRRGEENYKLVKSKLVEHFGDNYITNVGKRIEDLGISQSEFDEMAKTYPQMLFKALDMSPTNDQTYNGVPRNSAFKGQEGNPQAKTYSWWQREKANDPSLFKNKTKLQQMERDMNQLGEAFFDDAEPLNRDLYR